MSLSPDLIIQKYNQIQICKKKMATALCEIVEAITSSPKDLKAAEAYAYLHDKGILAEIASITNSGQPITMIIYRENQTSSYDGVYYLTFAFVFYGGDGKLFEDTAYIAFASSARGLILRKRHKSPRHLNSRLYTLRDKDDFSPMPFAAETSVYDLVFNMQEELTKFSTSLRLLTGMVGYECIPKRLRDRVIELQEFLD